MFAALKEHWPEYLMEAAGLGIIMISTRVVDALRPGHVPEIASRIRWCNHEPQRDAGS
jgi:hypothetical protein